MRIAQPATRSASHSKQVLPRVGFTLIELLVVIAIIAVLASLILPAVQSSRRSAFRAECLSNIRQVALGLQNFSSSNHDAFPHLLTPVQYTNVSGFQGTLSAPWPLTILPAIDNQGLFDNIRKYADQYGNLSQNEQIWIKAYTCPESDANRQPGGLSYVINTGFVRSDVWGTPANQDSGAINWIGACPFKDPIAGNVTVEHASGVSFVDGGASLGFITAGDGASNTLLLTENLQAGPWFGQTHNQIAFGIRVPVSTGSGGCPGDPPMSPMYSTNTTPPWNMASTSAPFNTDFPGSTFADPANNPDGWMINKNLNAATGTAPRPSSRHFGGVNAAFCDGSAKFINENINKIIFVKLMTSAGARYGEQTLNQNSY